MSDHPIDPEAIEQARTAMTERHVAKAGETADPEFPATPRIVGVDPGVFRLEDVEQLLSLARTLAVRTHAANKARAGSSSAEDMMQASQRHRTTERELTNHLDKMVNARVRQIEKEEEES